MLPLENLDKKNFKEILKESRKNIHRFSREWTDENYHDPGITFLEMLSWLTEMQRYYLNAVTEKNHLKFLKMHGKTLEDQGIAETYITFDSTQNKTIVPKGIKLLAEDQVFETLKSISITSNSIESVITSMENQQIDNTYSNLNKHIYFYGFGEKLNKGNRLYIGFKDRFQRDENIEILFNMFTDYPVKINGQNIYEYGIKGKWYTFTTSNKWEEIECLSNTTELFTKTGILSLKMNRDMKATTVEYNQGYYHWIMFEIEEFEAHVPPRIEYMRLNTVRASNVHSMAKIIELEIRHKLAIVDHYLALHGSCVLQYWKGGYWVDLEEKEYILERNYDNKKICIYFKGQYERLRMIAYHEPFKHESIIGSSNGLPNQSFKLRLDNIVPSSLVLQVGQVRDNKMIWKDFKYIENLVSSGPYDTHFSCNYEKDTIYFGDGEKGMIPFSCFENIRIVSLVKSNRERGNVKEGEVNRLLNKIEDYSALSLENITQANGGSSKMTLEDGKEVVFKDFNEIHRAVTKKDYEILVKRIPGVRIAMSKAIPCGENAVNIVVVPYTETYNPKPDRRLLDIVEKYLDDYRLITTCVKAIEPEYVEISVKCIISTQDRNKFDTIGLKEKIKKYLSPISLEQIDDKYEIGTPIYKNEILSIISEFDATKYVKELWLDGKGQGIKKDRNGNIFLAENGIYYCGKVEIELID
ncbi:baseplate J/gp47 family protein [Wukongibacter baidiensis]|uniref:baseplate J/gp47 family protein n=1 Tax=Wukongibacter baidiensis TaxID=1723361 RepID=UPI003D7F26AE